MRQTTDILLTGEAADDRKTAGAAGAVDCPAFERLTENHVRIGGFALARQVLRADGTRQAGFRADLVERFHQMNVSVLFQDGEAHQRQRAATARFFTPKTVATRYRPLMARLSADLVRRFRVSGRAVLDGLTLELAVGVAADIVGLTESRLPGMPGRLNRFFAARPAERGPLAQWLGLLASQRQLLGFYLVDVWPAIRARRREPRDDVISHLLGQGWSNREILTECLTYGAAGMATTREFIALAAWHLIEKDGLRTRFLQADEAGRTALLEEILRLEPVVGTLRRRLGRAMILEKDGSTESLPAGTLMTIDIRAVNGDSVVSGACPHRLDPDRTLDQPRASPSMSFGDGPHRCPGAAVALLQASIFLDHLLRVPGLRFERTPTVGWNPLMTGYELRDAVIVAG